MWSLSHLWAASRISSLSFISSREVEGAAGGPGVVPVLDMWMWGTIIFSMHNYQIKGTIFLIKYFWINNSGMLGFQDSKHYLHPGHRYQ